MRLSLRGCARLLQNLTAAVVLSACDSTPPELSQPARLVATSGGGQTVVNGPAAAAVPLVATVFDIKDRPVKGVTVTWSLSDPTGSLSAATSTTDSTGAARVTWTLGQAPGVQLVTATSPAINGSSAIFTGTNTVMAISGAVSVSSGVPLSFYSAAPGVAPMALPVGAVRYDASNTAVALEAGRASVRRLIVRFKDGGLRVAGGLAMTPAAVEQSEAAMEAALAPLIAHGLIANAEISPVILATRVTVPEHMSVVRAAAALRADPAIESVTLDEIMPMLDDYVAAPILPEHKPYADVLTGALPNEPFTHQSLWHYNMIEAPRAWATQTGSASVLVAVIDNGIRFEHPAMATCISHESCSAGNLTTDGYNFVAAGNRLSTPQPICGGGGTTLLTEAGPGSDPTQPDDLSFSASQGCWSRSTLGNHGLHVAGTIGARGNDGVGIAGINWNVKIRPVRALDITGSGSYFDIAQAVLYSAGLPASAGATTVTAPSRASVINMSLGGSTNNAVLASAVAAATNAGSLIIASAGNSQSNATQYPAGYPQVVAVSALGPDLSLSSYTNIGPNTSLAAPGGNFRSSSTSGVVSSTWDFVNNLPTYAYYQGTSMAAPHVAGVAALVLAANPGMTNAQLRARLQNTAVHMGSPGRDDRFGYGLVNAYNAVNNLTERTRATYVHVLSGTTGDTIRRLSPAADGSFSAPRVAPGSYWVVAGQDEGGDGRIGVPGRRFGWFGGPTGPALIDLAPGASAAVAIHAGMPTESKPNSTSATANRIVVNGYVTGQLNATYREAWFVVVIPRTQEYTFETNGVIGSCGYGIELDTAIDLVDANGVVLATNDDAAFPGSRFCSRVVRAMVPGAYYVRVRPGPATAIGQYALQVRDYP